MIDALLDALKDSLIVLAVILVFNILFSLIETKIASKLNERKSLSVLLGSSLGLIPQCGFSVIAADMYSKRKISIGTVVAIFIACSDEAIPIFLSNLDKAIYLLPLLLIKFFLALIVGFLTDVIYYRFKEKIHNDSTLSAEIHHGCCHHEIEEAHCPIKQHLIHPLLHSLKIFVYVLVINIIFSLLIYYVGEENIGAFISQSYYLTPLLATLVGLIPNCASSIIICELYLGGMLPFAGVVAGLICNAGLGLVYLFKSKKNIKDNIIIVAILISTSIIFGYLTLLIETLITK